jgi:N6-adenosine-specific RNA methylase IME4
MIPPGPKIAPLPTIDGGWACIEADVPWKYEVWTDPETEEEQRASRTADRHYETMTLDQIAAMPVKDIAARDSLLWFWVTGPFLVIGAHIPIIESWGFHVSSTGFVWVKLLKGLEAAQYQLMTMAELMELLVVNTGTGHTTRKNVEVCVLCRRGSPTRLKRDVHEVIIAPRRQHSRKPEEAYERIERYCVGPRLQLFARQPREGWTVWGNETAKFSG